MKIIRYSYCTLFDRNYLDKGLVMIDSFFRTNQKSKLYVLCMDEDVFWVLSQEYKAVEQLYLISFLEFATEELSKLKLYRSATEFCWTCSAFLIEYVFDRYTDACVTYIDADMEFYFDPDVLVDEMVCAEKSVQIIEHRFTMNKEGKKWEKESGKYCVEFNTFLNNSEGRLILSEWKKDVLQQCVFDTKKGLGDQFYLNDWTERYDCVNVLKNIGAGIAPWNIDRFKIIAQQQEERIIIVSFDGEGEYPAVFFHFHAIQFRHRKIMINVFRRYEHLDKKTVYGFYIPYLKEIKKKREKLKNFYGISLNTGSKNGESSSGKVAAGASFLKRIWNVIKKQNFRQMICLYKDYIDIGHLERYMVGKGCR